MQTTKLGSGKEIRWWTEGVPVDQKAANQIFNITKVPGVLGAAVMPDVHFGIGATIGSVIPTDNILIPAAVGVDIGCGMMAVKTTLRAEDLPDDLKALRAAIEFAVPHGFVSLQGRHTKGGWSETPTDESHGWLWSGLASRLKGILERYPVLGRKEPALQLGTLGGGNHFIEVCLDEDKNVWIMLHSGSRGIGNLIGQTFIEMARKDMQIHQINLPDKDLAYLKEGTEHFHDYVIAMHWAQDYAEANRKLMMINVLGAVKTILPQLRVTTTAVNCHHNFASFEYHYGKAIWITRKGAVRARHDEYGIIPGSMGAKSFIVRGRGNPLSYYSCSHGAGRVMSRGEAKRKITLAEHEAATAGVECRKDAGVIDESPAAYKDIDAVMKAQEDLVSIEAVLNQVLCVKG